MIRPVVNGCDRCLKCRRLEATPTVPQPTGDAETLDADPQLLCYAHRVTTKTRTGAEGYFARRASEPGYAEAYDEARRRIDAIDHLVRALDERREELGLSKAELARRAALAPEAVRRLFSVDSPNPTIGTLTALADALGLELVPQRRRAG